MKIEGSIVAITGAGGGLGAAMAERLAKQGARLALIDFRTDALENLKQTLAVQQNMDSAFLKPMLQAMPELTQPVQLNRAVKN